VKDSYSIEEIRAIPEVAWGSMDLGHQYVARTLYTLTHNIKSNAPYTVEGMVYADPRDQTVTILADTVAPTLGALDRFVVTQEIKNRLAKFKTNNKSVEEKMEEIYKDLEYNVTHIYGRKDMLGAMDLVFHSPLGITFQGKNKRGWMELLVVGDSRLGKSETSEQLVRHYQAGEIVLSENLTPAGLIGAAQQLTSKSWVITWGKWPMNDGGLLVLDEVSEMRSEDISKLSGVRSSGVAQQVKVQTDVTMARVRTIWTGNVKEHKDLSAYNYGCEALLDVLGGKSEDLARFDMALTLVDSEVDPETMDRTKQKPVKHVYDTESCRDLVRWAWTRKREQIVFSKEVEAVIIKEAIKMGHIYTSKIPLVTPSDQRIKLARLAASVATRLFSTTDGEKVIVKEEHVLYAVKFLRGLYDKPSMGYGLLSKEVMKSSTVSKADLKTWREEFKTFRDWSHLRDMLLTVRLFRLRDLMDTLDWPPDEGRRFTKWCSKHGLIWPTTWGFKKQPVFNEFLKGMLTEQDTTRIVDQSF
jgi:hypothetical protein